MKHTYLLLFIFSLLAGSLRAQFATIPNQQQERSWYQNELLRQTHQLHTAIRPWRKDEVNQYSRKYELLPDTLLLEKGLLSWTKRKLLYEHLVDIKTDNYRLIVDPVLYFGNGTENQSPNYDQIYRNSRGVRLEGNLGERFSFYTTYVESQGRFAAHINQLAQENEVVPGFWRTKPFRDNASDFGYAAGEIAYTAKKYFHFRLGRGKHFIGDGYRSMFLSDNSVNYPFFKIETTVGRLKYVNLWSVMNDLRDEVAPEPEVFAKKYLSLHYLSLNIGHRLNLGLFESLMWGDELQRFGFDVNFLNPVILFRPVEFSSGFRGGNIMLGFNGSYQTPWGVKAYGQVVIDEFNFADFRDFRNGPWQNMWAWQMGLQWGDAFGLRNLFLRAEYNAARPYTYSHRNVITNWSHYSQALAHPLGSNFNEVLLQAQYRYRRLYFSGALQQALVGRDPESGEHFGNDIFRPFSELSTPKEVFIGNGIRSTINTYRLNFSYLANPLYNLLFEISYLNRAESESELGLPNSRTLFVGIRTGLYDLYQDY